MPTLTNKIALYSGPYAPTGYIICRVVQNDDGKLDWDEKGLVGAKTLTEDEREDIPSDIISDMFTRLIQTDWDFPGVARNFGWSTRRVQNEDRPEDCRHEFTDGTIKCPECGMTINKFIASATDYLDEVANSGKVVDDPGYFEE